MGGVRGWAGPHDFVRWVSSIVNKDVRPTKTKLWFCY